MSSSNIWTGSEDTDCVVVLRGSSGLKASNHRTRPGRHPGLVELSILISNRLGILADLFDDLWIVESRLDEESPVRSDIIVSEGKLVDLRTKLNEVRAVNLAESTKWGKRPLWKDREGIPINDGCLSRTGRKRHLLIKKTKKPGKSDLSSSIPGRDVDVLLRKS